MGGKVGSSGTIAGCATPCSTATTPPTGGKGTWSADVSASHPTTPHAITSLSTPLTSCCPSISNLSTASPLTNCPSSNNGIWTNSPYHSCFLPNPSSISAPLSKPARPPATPAALCMVFPNFPASGRIPTCSRGTRVPHALQPSRSLWYGAYLRSMAVRQGHENSISPSPSASFSPHAITPRSSSFSSSFLSTSPSTPDPPAHTGPTSKKASLDTSPQASEQAQAEHPDHSNGLERSRALSTTPLLQARVAMSPRPQVHFGPVKFSSTLSAPRICANPRSLTHSTSPVHRCRKEKNFTALEDDGGAGGADGAAVASPDPRDIRLPGLNARLPLALSSSGNGTSGQTWGNVGAHHSHKQRSENAHGQQNGKERKKRLSKAEKKAKAVSKPRKGATASGSRRLSLAQLRARVAATHHGPPGQRNQRGSHDVRSVDNTTSSVVVPSRDGSDDEYDQNGADDMAQDPKKRFMSEAMRAGSAGSRTMQRFPLLGSFASEVKPVEKQCQGTHDHMYEVTHEDSLTSCPRCDTSAGIVRPTLQRTWSQKDRLASLATPSSEEGSGGAYETQLGSKPRDALLRPSLSLDWLDSNPAAQPGSRGTEFARDPGVGLGPGTGTLLCHGTLSPGLQHAAHLTHSSLPRAHAFAPRLRLPTFPPDLRGGKTEFAFPPALASVPTPFIDSAFAPAFYPDSTWTQERIPLTPRTNPPTHSEFYRDEDQHPVSSAACSPPVFTGFTGDRGLGGSSASLAKSSDASTHRARNEISIPFPVHKRHEPALPSGTIDNLWFDSDPEYECDTEFNCECDDRFGTLDSPNDDGQLLLKKFHSRFAHALTILTQAEQQLIRASQETPLWQRGTPSVQNATQWNVCTNHVGGAGGTGKAGEAGEAGEDGAPTHRFMNHGTADSQPEAALSTGRLSSSQTLSATAMAATDTMDIPTINAPPNRPFPPRLNATQLIQEALRAIASIQARLSASLAPETNSASDVTRVEGQHQGWPQQLESEVFGVQGVHTGPAAGPEPKGHFGRSRQPRLGAEGSLATPTQREAEAYRPQPQHADAAPPPGWSGITSTALSRKESPNENSQFSQTCRRYADLGKDGNHTDQQGAQCRDDEPTMSSSMIRSPHSSPSRARSPSRSRSRSRSQSSFRGFLPSLLPWNKNDSGPKSREYLQPNLLTPPNPCKTPHERSLACAKPQNSSGFSPSESNLNVGSGSRRSSTSHSASIPSASPALSSISSGIPTQVFAPPMETPEQTMTLDRHSQSLSHTQSQRQAQCQSCPQTKTRPRRQSQPESQLHTWAQKRDAQSGKEQTENKDGKKKKDEDEPQSLSREKRTRTKQSRRKKAAANNAHHRSNWDSKASRMPETEANMASGPPSRSATTRGTNLSTSSPTNSGRATGTSGKGRGLKKGLLTEGTISSADPPAGCLDHPSTPNALFPGEWICLLCDYELMYGQPPHMLAAVRRRARVEESRAWARDRAARLARGKPS